MKAFKTIVGALALMVPLAGGPASAWKLIAKRAGLESVRIHDLRHTYASFGAGSGLGLPIIGKLLGHREAATTQRYARLDNDPLRRAANAIGGQIAAALGGKA